MNIVKLQNSLKDLSDRQLLDTMQTASAPQYLVLAEMQRRKELRSGAERQQPQAETSVAEEIMGGIASMPVQNAMPQMASGGIVGFAGGGRASAYSKGSAEACYKNPETGQTECPPAQANLLKGKATAPKAPKKTGLEAITESVKKISNLQEGGIVGFANRGYVDQDAIYQIESSNRQFDKDGNVIMGKELRDKKGEIDTAVGKGQVRPSTAEDPGYGIPNIYELAKAQGIETGPVSRNETIRLLSIEPLNEAMSSAYYQGMVKAKGEENAAQAYFSGPTNVEKGNIGPKGEAYQQKFDALTSQTGSEALADLGYGRGSLGPGELEPTRKYAAPQSTAEALAALGEGKMPLRGNEMLSREQMLDMADESRDIYNANVQRRATPNMPMGDGIAALGEGKMPLRGNEQLSTQELKDMAAESQAIRARNAQAAPSPMMEMGDAVAALGEGKMPLRGNEQLSIAEQKAMEAESQAIRDARDPLNFADNPEREASYMRYLDLKSKYEAQQAENEKYASRSYTGKMVNEPGRFFFGAGEQMQFPFDNFEEFYWAEQRAGKKPMTAKEGIAALGEGKMELRGGEKESTEEKTRKKDVMQEQQDVVDKVTGAAGDLTKRLLGQAAKDRDEAYAKAEGERRQAELDALLAAERAPGLAGAQETAKRYGATPIGATATPAQAPAGGAPSTSTGVTNEKFTPTGSAPSAPSAGGTGSSGGYGGAAAGSDAEYIKRLRERISGIDERDRMSDLMLASGLGMMASQRPDFLGAVGEGGLAGLTTMLSAQRGDEKAIEKLLDLEQNVRSGANVAAAKGSMAMADLRAKAFAEISDKYKQSGITIATIAQKLKDSDPRYKAMPQTQLMAEAEREFNKQVEAEVNKALGFFVRGSFQNPSAQTTASTGPATAASIAAMN
jgi:hypothetical protein